MNQWQQKYLDGRVRSSQKEVWGGGGGGGETWRQRSYVVAEQNLSPSGSELAI